MTYRSLLVLLDTTPLGLARTQVAIKLAKTFECHLVGLAATGLVDLPVATQNALTLADYTSRAWSVLRSEAAQAAARFDEACAAAGLHSFESLTDDENRARSLVDHALCCDLTLLTQADPTAEDGHATREMLEQVVLHSARPTLVLPYAGHTDAIGRRVLVAWNNSREAARAVTDALPFLRTANSVQVVAWDEGHAGGKPLAHSLESLQRWLGWQDIGCEVHIEKTSIHVGEAMLSRAADLGADLIVMGAYGHARWSERILGGATRGLLDAMTVPVLMSH